MTTPTSSSVDPQLVYEYSAGRTPADTIGLQRRIDAALSALRGYCGWMPFPVRDEEFVLNGYGQYPLQLPTMHVEDITKVKVNGQEVPLDQIEWGHNGVVYLHHSDQWTEYNNPYPKPWPKRLRGIEISASHGFPLEDCMDLVGSVCDVISRSVYNPRGETMIRVGERQSQFGALAGGLVIGTRPTGPELELWSKYILPSTTWEGG